jgi:hypothetical protein
MIRSLIVLLFMTNLASATQNVVIVLDNSGSMQFKLRDNKNLTRMDAAKIALINVVSNLPNDTKLGIVLLNGQWNPDKWLVPLKILDKKYTTTQIKSFHPNGGTPLGGCMKTGTDVLLDLRKNEQYGPYRLLVVTDGEATDPALVESYLPDIMSRGIIVDCIGVDMVENHSLATKVNNYRKGNNPEQLAKAISATFAETSNGKDAEEDFKLLDSIPDGMAPKLLIALGQVGNHPIGEVPVDEEAGVNTGSTRTAVVKTSYVTPIMSVVIILMVIFVVAKLFMLML